MKQQHKDHLLREIERHKAAIEMHLEAIKEIALTLAEEVPNA